MGNFREVLGVSEISSSKVIDAVWKALLAEFLGNFLLNFFGCGSVIVMSSTPPGAQPNFLLVAITFGLVVFVCVQALGHVSGAHLNPAVTAGMLSVGNIKIIKGLMYIIVQCLGAIAGSATLKALLPETLHTGGLGTTKLNTALEINPLQGFGFEFFLGFILVLVVSGVCDPNRPEAKAAGPLAIGLAVALGHMGAINFTGSSMNPARSFGSAVISGIWDDHYIYWLGPIVGGIIAAQIYHHALRAPTLTTVKIIES
ncbi:aquaporin AQPAe.a isoform X2 [Anthonomus grandis grandis]|uniref:aquaporin AQPAe.a isoform X2 n=1 Tax=Anthonomus grandis grandis TaxID=2921223 RepID=UPI002166C063|nr:aquaporin AQPAe.a isoform X2 [Anthonomus grandis grandis]